MSLLDSLMSSGGNNVVQQLATQFGLSPEQANSAASAILPTLANGMKEHMDAGDSGGIGNLINNGVLSRFANDPSNLGTSAAVDHGNSILGNIFESSELTQMADSIGAKAGIPSSTVNSLLPVAAAALGGMLSQHAASGGNVNDALGHLSGTESGSMFDAVKSIASKMLG